MNNRKQQPLGSEANQQPSAAGSAGGAFPTDVDDDAATSTSENDAQRQN